MLKPVSPCLPPVLPVIHEIPHCNPTPPLLFPFPQPGNLAHDEDNKVTLLACVHLAKAAMTAHGGVSFVQRQAVLYLWNLSFSDANLVLLRSDAALASLVRD